MYLRVIAKVPGSYHTYYNSDSLTSEDGNDVRNYLPEYLHGLTSWGMLPHKLELKEEVIVMLLRNLYPKQELCNSTKFCITGLK